MEAINAAQTRTQDTGAGRLIRGMLTQREAVAVPDLVAQLGMDEETVRWAIQDLLREGVAERLRPLGYACDDKDYFRLKREHDTDYVWQKRLLHVIAAGEFEQVFAL